MSVRRKNREEQPEIWRVNTEGVQSHGHPFYRWLTKFFRSMDLIRSWRPCAKSTCVLVLDRTSLGQGKRQLFTGGVYDSNYGITVPAPKALPDA